MRELFILRLLKHKAAYTDITPEQEAACFWKAQTDVGVLRQILIDLVARFRQKKTRNMPEVWVFAKVAYDVYAEVQDWDVLLAFEKQPGKLVSAARKFNKQYQLTQAREENAADVLHEHLLEQQEQANGK